MSQNLDKWFGLRDTCCVLAGANGLLGRASAEALNDCGAEVIGLDLKFDSKSNYQQKVVDITEDKALTEFYKKLSSDKSTAKNWAFINLSYPRSSNWGELGFENVTAKDWNENVDLQLRSGFRFCQLAVDFLKKKGGGSILQFGSIYGLVGPDLRIYDGTAMKNCVAYAAIKGGMAGFVRYIATAFGSSNIRANVLCPGGIRAGTQAESFVKAYESRTPLGRMGNPEDIAGAVCFLVGPSGKYISGQVIAADGGFTAW